MCERMPTSFSVAWATGALSTECDGGALLAGVRPKDLAYASKDGLEVLNVTLSSLRSGRALFQSVLSFRDDSILKAISNPARIQRSM